MRVVNQVMVCGLVIFLSGLLAARIAAQDSPPGFQALFNGRDFSGWRFLGGDGNDWVVDGGALVTNGRPRGWLMTEREYDDFELRLEYRVSQRGNSGVLLRGAPADDLAAAGMEIQILDDEAYPDQRPVNYTGAIFNVAPRSRRAARPVGEWNAMRIVAKGTQITVFLNDVQVVDADLNDYKDQYARKPWLNRSRGTIGLQSWDGKVEFRNLQVKGLSDPAPSPPVPVVPTSDEAGFRSLFNGRDLAGWNVEGEGENDWRVDDGCIVGFSTDYRTRGYLLTDSEYSDFLLRLEFQLDQEKASSAIAIRAVQGEEVPIERNQNIQDHPIIKLTGVLQAREETCSSHWVVTGDSINAHVKPSHRAETNPPGSWNALEIEVRGRTLRATVNGKLTTELTSAEGARLSGGAVPGLNRAKGRIGLQKHTGAVRFRNMRIRGLQEAPTPQLVLDTAGHNGKVRGIAFSADSRQLISVSEDKTIRIWDLADGKPLRVLRPPVGAGRHGLLFGVAVSPDGRLLAVGGYDHQAYLIDLESGRIVRTLAGHRGSIMSVEFTADGQQVITGSFDRTARIWDVASGKFVQKFEGHQGPLVAARANREGRLLATATSTTCSIWSIPEGKQLWSTYLSDSAAIRCLAWNPDGRTFAVGAADHSITVRDSTGSVVRRFEAPGWVSSLTYATDGQSLLYTCIKYKMGAIIIDPETGTERVRFDRSWNDLSCSALSPDGRLAATGGFNGADLRVWNRNTGVQVYHLPGVGGAKWAATWAASGHTVAWGDDQYPEPSRRHFNDLGPVTHTFDLAALELGEATEQYPKGPTVLDGAQLGYGTESTLVIKRDGQADAKIDVHKAVDVIRSASWLDANRIVIGSVSGPVALVDAGTGNLLQRLTGHTGAIWAIAPSLDRRFILTGSYDRTLRIWTPDRESPILSLFFGKEGEWIAWTPEGYYAASPGGEHLMGWQVNNGSNAMASFYPASQFRKTLYRPDVIKRLFPAGSLEIALADANAAAGISATQTDVAQILPPKISIIKPASPRVQLTDRTTDVEAVAQSVGANPITSLRVLIDGRPVPDALTTYARPIDGEARAKWTVEVPPGAHRLAVEASTSASKSVSDPVDLVGPAGDDANAAGRLFVVVIGINDYLHLGNLAKLDCAVPDAQAIHKAFQDLSRPLFRSVESRVLLDRQATRANILDALQWLKQSAAPGDKAVVFYAGHGDNQVTGQFFILPVDARIDNLPGTGISDADLKKAIGDLPCSTLLMLDACYSGSFGQKKRKTRSLVKPTDALASSMVNDYGLAILCGARDNQEAIEEGGHGFFTQALTQGLAGEADADKDGVVELYELLPFVKSRVSKLSAGDQVPTVGLPPSVESFALSKP